MVKERRSNYPMSEDDVYKLAAMQDFAKKEKRRDELDRINEAREQKVLWYRLMIASSFMTLLYVSLAIWGIYK